VPTLRTVLLEKKLNAVKKEAAVKERAGAWVFTQRKKEAGATR